jgi:WD40 repeat protein
MKWKKIGLEGGAMGTSSMLKIWDIETGEERLQTEFSENGGGLLSFSPDGKWLACPNAGTVELREVSSGNVAKKLPVGGTNCLEFRPDSLQLAIASTAGSVTLWDLVSGQQVQTLHGHAQSVYSISYRSDGMELATSGSDATIRLWETATGRETRVYRFRDNHSTVAFDRNDLRLVTITGGGYNNEPVRKPLPRELTVWDAKTSPGVAIFQPPDGRGQAGRSAYELEFNHDGSLLACGRGNRLVIWDTATQQIVQTLFDKDHRPTVQMIGIAFDAAGGRVAAGYADSESTAKVWDVKTGQLLYNLVGHRGRVHSVAFSPDDLTLATASQDATVRIWSLQDGKLMAELKVAEQDARPLTKIIFRPGGRELAVGTRGGSIQIWDLATRKLRTAIGPKQDTYSIAYSRDGGRIASGANTKVTIWNANTGELIREFKGHTAGVFDLCFSPDGRRLFSLGLGEARIWDSESGQQILMLSKVYGGAVRLDPKGNRIATFASSGIPQIWDASRFAIPANLPAVSSDKVLP